MSFTGTLYKTVLRLQVKHLAEAMDPYEQQYQVLMYLLSRAKDTDFGRKYSFKKLLSKHFTQRDSKLRLRIAQAQLADCVPSFTYESMYTNWWARLCAGEKNVSWPGHAHLFAISSGTSIASSKYIPLTEEMLSAIRKVSMLQLQALMECTLPGAFFSKKFLFLSGTTSLQPFKHAYCGDLSGILSKHVPLWFRRYYKPEKKINSVKNWEEKLRMIVKEAPKWDIGAISGSPTWLQILLERIIQTYQLGSIHEIWPNLQVFVHGGVSFEVYRRSFQQLLSKNLLYLETYLASEGFIAYQASPSAKTLRLALNGGMFFEFVPFTSKYFDENGKLLSESGIVSLADVDTLTPYALLISSCAGLWRYHIGDVVVFKSLYPHEIVITGRTQHFLNLCGEHVSIDNMQQAVMALSAHLNLPIYEFTLSFYQDRNGYFQHIWYLGLEKSELTNEEIAIFLDKYLMRLNDDYAMQRSALLLNPKVECLSEKIFYDWLAVQGKVGGQHKFPRVLRKKQLEHWKNFLQTTVSIKTV